MEIINITNPGKDPKHGDLLRYEYPNGDFVEKQFSAVFSLALSIIIWNTLQYLIVEEKFIRKKVST